jgi:hypothetical protein
VGTEFDVRGEGEEIVCGEYDGGSKVFFPDDGTAVLELIVGR